EGTTGKTLGTDLRKGKFTLPVLIFLRSASEFERERSASLILEGKCDEVSQLLKNGGGNGALSESITTASDLIRSAQAGMKALRPNAYTEGLLGLGDALREMVEQLREERCRRSRFVRCRRKSGRAKNSPLMERRP